MVRVSFRVGVRIRFRVFIIISIRLQSPASAAPAYSTLLLLPIY